MMVQSILQPDLPTLELENGLVRAKAVLKKISTLLREIDRDDLSDLHFELQELVELATTLRDQAKSRAEFHATGERSRVGCIVTKMVGKWGPYQYRVVKIDGKQHWTYLGKVGEKQ